MDNVRKLEQLVSETEDLLDEVQDNPGLDDVRDRLQRSLRLFVGLIGAHSPPPFRCQTRNFGRRLGARNRTRMARCVNVQ